MQLRVDFSISWNRPERKDAWNGPERKDGVYTLLPMQLRVVISIFCSGLERKDADGMRGLVSMQLRAAISTSCSGPELVPMQPRVVI